LNPEKTLREFSIEPEKRTFSVSRVLSHDSLGQVGTHPCEARFFETDGKLFVLYTKGSVDFFSAYPGLYVPRPLGFRCDRTAQTPNRTAREILALTKMNWDNTQFDRSEPITMRAARQVGSILKHLGSEYEPYYRFYM